MLHSIWNHRGPYRVTAEASSPPRTSAWAPPAPTAPSSTRAVVVAGASRPAAEQAVARAVPDLGALIELKFKPMRKALLASVCLRQALRDLAPALARTPQGLPGLALVLLVQALATATGADTARAAVALAALRQFDPRRDIAHAWQLRGEPCAAPSPDSVTAWRVAMELGATPAGMDVLQAVLEVPVAPAHRPAFAALLAAARTAQQPATPVSLLRGPAIPPALGAAAARLVAAAPTVPALAETPRTATTGRPVRLRSAPGRSVPFSAYAMASWSFFNSNRPAAGIASTLAHTLVRHVARPLAAATVLASP